jgi:WD40 repeat protein
VVWDLDFSADGTRLATAGDQSVKVWTVPGGKLLKSHATQTAETMALSPDGERVAFIDGQTPQIWEPRADAVTVTYPTPGHRVARVRFSHDGQRIAVLGGFSDAASLSRRMATRIDIWRAETPDCLVTRFDPEFHTFRLSPDGETVLGYLGLGDFHRKDAATGRVVRVIPARSIGAGAALDDPQSGAAEWCFAGDPQSGRVALVKRERGRFTVKVWGPAGDDPIAEIPVAGAAPPRLAFRPGGETLAVGDPAGTVALWGVPPSESPARTLAGHTGEVTHLEYSRDGRRLVSAGRDGHARLWDADTGAELRDLAGHAGAVLAATFSSDGERLASAGEEGVVRVWDIATGGERLTFRGYTEAVLCVAFSPDGRRVASGGVDRTVQLWDAANGGELLTLTGHREAVRDCRFSADGDRLLTLSQGEAVRIWDGSAPGPDRR